MWIGQGPIREGLASVSSLEQKQAPMSDFIDTPDASVIRSSEYFLDVCVCVFDAWEPR